MIFKDILTLCKYPNCAFSSESLNFSILDSFFFNHYFDIYVQNSLSHSRYHQNFVDFFIDLSLIYILKMIFLNFDLI